MEGFGSALFIVIRLISIYICLYIYITWLAWSTAQTPATILFRYLKSMICNNVSFNSSAESLKQHITKKNVQIVEFASKRCESWFAVSLLLELFWSLIPFGWFLRLRVDNFKIQFGVQTERRDLVDDCFSTSEMGSSTSCWFRNNESRWLGQPKLQWK